MMLSALSLIASLAAHADDDGAMLMGTVQTDAARGVSGVTVRLSSAQHGDMGHQRTDAQGRYQIGDLPPGQYTVSVDHPRYLSHTTLIDITGDELVYVDVSLRTPRVIWRAPPTRICGGEGVVLSQRTLQRLPIR